MVDFEKIKERLRKESAQQREERLSRFERIRRFETPDDIPDIPVVPVEDYRNIIVPNLIRCGAIPKRKLRVGVTYIGSCRNADEAVWNGRKFEYRRYKFGEWYDDTINHFEDDDGYDVFVPIIEK